MNRVFIMNTFGYLQKGVNRMKVYTDTNIDISAIFGK